MNPSLSTNPLSVSCTLLLISNPTLGANILLKVCCSSLSSEDLHPAYTALNEFQLLHAGSATVEREGLSATLVKDMRNYFQISPEYFSMLLVGKDGNVKSWYPSPMWSMAIIYDLVDSMQLRRQEMAIQQSLGMRCPEDEYGGYGYHQHGYEHGYQEGYHQGYGY